MAEQFPRASKRQAGGTKMIQTFDTVCDVPASGTAMPENPIPAKKKKHLQVRQRRSCRHVTLIAGPNRFACRKSYPNTAAARVLLELIGTETDAEMETQIGAPVTTSHLFEPNQRRMIVPSLPISLRNLSLSAEAVAPQLTGRTAGSNRVSGLRQTLAAHTAKRLHPPGAISHPHSTFLRTALGSKSRGRFMSRCRSKTKIINCERSKNEEWQ
jgi:hypothetical protein